MRGGMSGSRIRRAGILGRACSRQMDLWMEVLLQSLPAGVVFVLASRCVHRELRRATDETGFKHKSKSAFKFDGL